MKHALTIAASAFAFASASGTAHAVDYLPVGVQTNVATSTVTGGGWSQCYSATYGASGQTLSSILAGCSGSRLMLAARATGSNTLLLLGQAAFSDVTFDVGTGNTTHNANGIEWYFDESYSWGFAPGGAAVSRESCDTAASDWNTPNATTSQRLCWHTGNNLMNGGWRAGSNIDLNSSSAYEKVIFTFNGNPGAVPEPATWAMMLLGMAAVGGAMRRRRQTARVAFAF